jgi:hypothetical protein
MGFKDQLQGLHASSQWEGTEPGYAQSIPQTLKLDLDGVNGYVTLRMLNTFLMENFEKLMIWLHLIYY